MSSREQVTEDEWRILVGIKIRDARVAAGLTLRETAEGLGIRAPFLCDIQTGRKQASAYLLYRLGCKLGVDLFLGVRE